MVQFVHWTYLFWINLPIAVVSFGLIAWALQDQPLPAHRRAIKGRPPLLNLRTFLDRRLAAAFSANLLVGFSLMVGLVSVPLFINLAGAESGAQGALASGVMLSAFTIPMALAAVPGGWLASRYGDRLVTVVGVLLALGGFALMTRWHPEYARQAAQFVAGLGEPGGLARGALEGAGTMGAGLGLAGIGLGLTIAPIGSTVINGVGDSERGLASALVIVLRLIGMSLSVSTLTRYGLRRSTELSQELLAGVGLTEFGRIAEAGIQVATRVTVEMAGIAVGVCALALIPSLLMRPKAGGPAPELVAPGPG